MGTVEPFDLPEFMRSYFPRVDFGGDLFKQTPIGLRFEVGIDHVFRAVRIFDFLLSGASDLVLISQDWILEEGAEDICKPSTPLFQTPSIVHSDPSSLETLDVFPRDETPYRLTWTRLSPLAFNAALMFQGIANREQGGAPRVLSGVYVIDPHAKVILHMYDDRGLDILALEIETLRSLYEKFGEWVPENQRQQIVPRFEESSRHPSV